MAATLDLTLGVIEIGAMVSIFIYGIITVQVYIYTQANFKDNFAIRLLVSLTWVTITWRICSM